jgi:crotonobetainyl-CoA:carnitine CoA-transferase CaiB-like acyl-CoA transferase
MFETMAQFVLGDHLSGRTFEPPLGEAGYARVLARARAPYATADGFICALIYNDRQWQRFFDAIGAPQMMQDPRFVSLSARARHIEEICAFVATTLRTRSTADWAALFSAADIPWMRMNSLDELIDDPHLGETHFFRRMQHPSEGVLRTTAIPTRFSCSVPAPAQPAPRLGQHSAEILREVGYSDAEIRSMAAQGATLLEEGAHEKGSGGDEREA